MSNSGTIHKRKRPQDVHAHRLIGRTAKGIADNFYEAMASNSNTFYALYPDRKEWVQQAWPLFLDEARATLAKLLTTMIDESLKEDIKDALIRDASLMRGRKGIGQISIRSEM